MICTVAISCRLGISYQNTEIVHIHGFITVNSGLATATCTDTLVFLRLSMSYFRTVLVAFRFWYIIKSNDPLR